MTERVDSSELWMTERVDNSELWAKVQWLNGGKFVMIFDGTKCTDSINLTDEEWEVWADEIMEWEPAFRVTFGDTTLEPRTGETFYVHPECYDAQLDALVML